MAITWADVVLLPGAAGLSTVPTATQNAILADVYEEMNADTWGSVLDLGAKCLAAHYGLLHARAGAPMGPVSQRTVGPVSQSFAVAVPQDPDFGSTSFGLRYLRLMNNLPAARFTIADPC